MDKRQYRRPKLIGKGSYGCVYAPSMTCKNKQTNFFKPQESSATNNSSNHVSKLTQHKYADEEIGYASIMQKIDPKNKYHLPTPTKCDPTPRELKVVSQCSSARIDKQAAKKNTVMGNNHLQILQIKNGGIELEEYIQTWLEHGEIGRAHV